MDMKALQTSLRAFAAQRNWQQFHTPKNLAMALMVEAAELAEIFQWMTPDQSLSARADKVLQARIGEEMADVLIYLLQLADHTAVDIDHAVADKLLKNAQKHPPIAVGLTSVPVALKAGQAHVLIDWENVQPKEADIRALVPDVSDVWIFHGPNQKRVGADQASFGDNVTLVPISRTGKNALDFHLSFYMGYIASRNPAARFVVISNDQGYGPMLEHAAELGFAASQLGFSARKVSTRKTAPRTSAAKKPTAAKKAAQPPAKAASPKPAKQERPPVARKTLRAQAAKVTNDAGKGPAAVKPARAKASVEKATRSRVPANQPKRVKQTPVVTPAGTLKNADQAYAHVVASLRKSQNRPTRKARLYGAVKSLLIGAGGDAAEVEAVVGRLTSDGYLAIDDKGAVVMRL
jgi:NTP pyrophosphatase (non-canonical NTP hydrolase)